MVALTSCGVVLVLVAVLCILCLSSVPPVPAIRRRLFLGQCDAGCTLYSQMERKITSRIPCCAHHKNEAELNDPGVTFELTELQSSHTSGSNGQISVRKRVWEHTVDSFQEEVVTVHRHQESPLDSRRECKNYLDMDQFNLPNHMYENIICLPAAEQVQRWCSYFLLEDEYLDPAGIQVLPAISDSKSDPDESCS